MHGTSGKGRDVAKRNLQVQEIKLVLNKQQQQSKYQFQYNIFIK